MEATPANVSKAFETRLIEASGPGDSAAGARFDFYNDLMVTSFDNKRQSNPRSQHLQESCVDQTAMVQVPTSPPGVSNCYIFKSQLQEYAQKVGLPTPVYETIKEGPSHQPSFKSTVIVGGDRYDSLPGFLNRKAAEQSAAEIALMELSKCGPSKESISLPVHETGLCKNLLQDYSQKMNYALPIYTCKRDDTPGKTLPFSCTVEIGGIRYIGAAAKTRKEAEIKAARTALLAIQSNPSIPSVNLSNKSQHTVVPPKRKVPDTDPSQGSEKPKKPKRSRFKKKHRNNTRNLGKVTEKIQPKSTGILASNNDMGTMVGVQQIENGSSDVQVPVYVQTPQRLPSSAKDNIELNVNQHIGEASTIESGLVVQAPLSDANADPGATDMAFIPNPPPSEQMDASRSGVSPGLPEPVIVDTNHERDENPTGTIVDAATATPLPAQEFDPPVSNPRICQGEPGKHERKENTTTGTSVDPAMADPPPTQE